MSDVPLYLIRPIDRAMRRALAAGSLELATVLCTFWYDAFVVYLMVAMAGVVAIVSGVQWFIGMQKLPKRLRQHELQVARRAEEVKAREIEAARRREENLQTLEAMEHQRIEAFRDAANLGVGERMTLQTSAGPIWVTRCVTGTIRLWWGFNTRIRELAVPVVRSRARYEGKSPVAWFIYPGKEREVLLDLARI